MRRRAFTLLELLIVIAILALLLGILVPRFTRATLESERSAARARLQGLELLAQKYELDLGDFPPSRLAALGIDAPNLVNEGGEALAAALFLPAFSGPRPEEELLGNADEDLAREFPSVLQTKELFELTDPWGNPYAYFHHRDYEEPQSYRTKDEFGDLDDRPVEAGKNPKTGLFRNLETFQIFSAGPDGLFGTEDDVGPWI